MMQNYIFVVLILIIVAANIFEAMPQGLQSLKEAQVWMDVTKI